MFFVALKQKRCYDIRMGFLNRATEFKSGSEYNDVQKEKPTQNEILEGLEKEENKAKKLEQIRTEGNKEAEHSGAEADVYISLFELVEKYPEELGTTGKNVEETISILQKFINEQCLSQNSDITETDKLNLWAKNLDQLIKTGNPAGLKMLRGKIENGKQDKIVSEAEGFDDKIMALKDSNADSGEFIKLIDSYLKLGEAVNRSELLGYKKLFSIPTSSQQDQEIIKKVAVEGLSSGTSVLDSVASLYENENLSEQTKTTLKQAFPEFPDTRMESGIEKYAIMKDETLAQTRNDLSLNERELAGAEADLSLAEESGDEAKIKAAKEKLAQLKDEQEYLQQQINSMQDQETGRAMFKFRLQKATVFNEGGRKYMELNWPSKSSYRIELNRQGHGFEETYEKIVAYEGLGGQHGAARYLMRIPDGHQLGNTDVTIGSMSITEMYSHLGLDTQFGEVISTRDQKRFNSLAGCFDGAGTPLQNLQELGIINSAGIIDDKKWEQTISFMRQHIDEGNFLTFQRLKKYLTNSVIN